MEKGVLIRNEGKAKVVFAGGEISPSEYKAVSKEVADKLCKLFDFIKVIPSVEEVQAKQDLVKAEADREFNKQTGRRKK